MKRIRRELQSEITRAARAFPGLVVSGPRRSGKTFLLKQAAFPKASYHLLEDPDVLDRIKADPKGWLDEVRLPAILDEIQNAPELFSYIRARIDSAPRKNGQWILTGSQEFGLMRGVSESMAGRAAIFQLLPFSYREIGSWNLLRGSFPEVVARPSHAATWFRSYLQTYLERDLRSLLSVRDLSTFRRFLSLLAIRNGQILNKTQIAGPLGVSIPTVTEWLSVLEVTGQILIVPPYFENFEKRLIKSPKVYWVDPGLVCFLLGIESRAALEKSPFVGVIFEGFVASEIIKNQINAGRPRELYFFRDQQGLEVDFLLPRPGGKLLLIETKYSKTITSGMAAPIQKLKAAIRKPGVEGVIVYRDEMKSSKTPLTVADGVRGMTVEQFLSGDFQE